MLSLVNIVTSVPSDCSTYNKGALLGVTMYPEIIDSYTHYLKFTTVQKIENKVSLDHILVYDVTVRNESNLDNPYLINNVVTSLVLNIGDDNVNQIDFVGLAIYVGCEYKNFSSFI
ncbi:18555_t:CDS:1 [Gigaspora margarita]|uniref:18555_t:CDS:1 n=1 Tax=Gigaspora margarita TaxID=4874 RepID=A0ABN7VTX2_GIGMA|nr:18555_t:CDS:1 [Gigaspora margarita]